MAPTKPIKNKNQIAYFKRIRKAQKKHRLQRLREPKADQAEARNQEEQLNHGQAPGQANAGALHPASRGLRKRTNMTVFATRRASNLRIIGSSFPKLGG